MNGVFFMDMINNYGNINIKLTHSSGTYLLATYSSMIKWDSGIFWAYS